MRRFGWYSDLQKKEKRTYWACFGGLALDSMDSTIFALVMPVLITVLNFSKGDAGILGSVALVSSAIGGWGAGILADRYGRVRLLQITVVWVGLATLLAGFCSEFWEFFAVRALQGMGYGGEAAVGAVLISETITPLMRGRVASSIQSGYAVGYAISVSIMPLIFAFAPEHIAWRLFFGIGILPAFLVWFIRRLVSESEVYKAEQVRLAKNKERRRIDMIFRGPQLKVTLISTLLAAGVLGGAYVLITWLPTYLRMSLGLPVTSTSGYLFVNILGSFVGPFIYGLVSDRLGRGRTFMLFLSFQAINVAVYMFAPISPAMTIAMGFLLGMLQAGVASGLVLSISELFPTSMRANGAGFCNSIGRGLGAVVPAIVGLLSSSIPLGTAMGICAISSYGVGIIAALLLPNATGVDMSQSSPLEKQNINEANTEKTSGTSARFN